jgi:hypothetical protein
VDRLAALDGEAMTNRLAVLLTDWCREHGYSYNWFRHRTKWFNWTGGADGRLYVDPDEMGAYLAQFVGGLPPAAFGPSSEREAENP